MTSERAITIAVFFLSFFTSFGFTVVGEQCVPQRWMITELAMRGVRWNAPITIVVAYFFLFTKLLKF